MKEPLSVRELRPFEATKDDVAIDRTYKLEWHFRRVGYQVLTREGEIAQ